MGSVWLLRWLEGRQICPCSRSLINLFQSMPAPFHSLDIKRLVAIPIQSAHVTFRPIAQLCFSSGLYRPTYRQGYCPDHSGPWDAASLCRRGRGDFHAPSRYLQAWRRELHAKLFCQCRIKSSVYNATAAPAWVRATVVVCFPSPGSWVGLFLVVKSQDEGFHLVQDSFAAVATLWVAIIPIDFCISH